MKICVYGLGAVGGLVGGKLAAAGYQVSAVVRNEKVDLIRRNGLQMMCQGQSQRVTLNVSDDPAELQPQDMVIVSVKNTAIGSVAESIQPLLHDKTIIVSAMNGVPWWFYHGLAKAPRKRLETVDPGGVVTKAMSPDRVVGCVTNLSASTPAPGVVDYLPNPKFTFGEPTGGADTKRCISVISAMKTAGFDVHASNGIQETIWFKLWGNMTVNPISAMTGATSDKIVGDVFVRNFMKRCMLEAQDVGNRIGIEIPSTPEERFEATAKLGAFRTSMLQDVLAQRPIELDAIVGAVLEIADQVGVETPNIDTLFGLSRIFAKERRLYAEKDERGSAKTIANSKTLKP
ncbi:2-dehydropantoate 2-reductase [Bordetella trematum]|uniref:2-dehydropantoate 2-reductase n=1 Tax=Bordetella trematum TaxID=123899 RepID=UPI0015589EB9